MPRKQDLPEALASLSRRNAIELSETRFHADVKRLIEAIEKSLRRGQRKKRSCPRRRSRPRRSRHPLDPGLKRSNDASEIDSNDSSYPSGCIEFFSRCFKGTCSLDKKALDHESPLLQLQWSSCLRSHGHLLGVIHQSAHQSHPRPMNPN